MPLVISAVKTLLVHGVIQSAAFFIFYRLWGFPVFFLLLFLGVQMVFHLGVLIFLVKNRRLFYKINGGQRETCVNAANKITLFRITTIPFLVFLTLVSQRFQARPVLAAAFALTFASDFLDGWIARTWRLETYIGRILDSASDYLLLGVLTGALFFFKRVSSWLFWLIIGRLLLNVLVMFVLFLVHKKLRPQTTPLGKTAIAAIMVLLVMEAAKPMGLPGWIIHIERAAALVIGLSVIDKLVYLARGLRGKASEPLNARS
ncbi:MAG: CDP-alcohol phosphatidyltransferase family protein [Spirochaetaceae bacterium]|jgi:phosphatidylglycerophosphate synthase|nr:CDP-alcohol phosphatidyltransferase family protein [Spirochaetaceae bacterium]